MSEPSLRKKLATKFSRGLADSARTKLATEARSYLTRGGVVYVSGWWSRTDLSEGRPYWAQLTEPSSSP